MELKRFIFDLRFKPTFAWLDKKGSILTTLQESKLFDTVGYHIENVNGKANNEDSFRTITLETQRLSGAIEYDSVNLENIKEILKLARNLCENISLNSNSIIRLGTRFQFIKPFSFDKANDFFIKMMSPDIIKIVSGDSYVDSAIIPVVKYGDNTAKFMMGPIKKAELPNYFDKHKRIEFDEGFMFDVDYFSNEYHSLRIDKFAEEAYNKVNKKIKELEELLESNVNNE